ncbi:MAG: hypothetical protein WB586_05410 [Chthoniobacterales bacterium]
MDALSQVAFGQGIYYVVTALWPFFHMGSFLLVTGPKTDLWLVRTVGALILVIGLPLFLTPFYEKPPKEIILLGVAAAVALASVDVYYVVRCVISPIYLVDGAIEIGFLAAWLWAYHVRA